ncbi:MAG: ParB N-terminal domain-containing protein [Abditibacteriota bacterium]|nr:ParB N-terminal domain-containing protein [Abditibacteriota bacterium]
MLIQISKITVGPDRPPADPAHVRKLTTSLGTVGILSSITISDDFRLIAGLLRLEAAKALGWTEIECVIQPLHGLEAELAELDEDVVRKDISGVIFGEKLLRRKEVYETLYPETRAGTAQANGMNRALGRRVKDDLPPDAREDTWVDKMSATSKSDLSGCGVEDGSVDKMSATLETTSPVRMDAPIDKMTGKIKSFVDDTAEKMNVTPRTVRRQLQAARNLNADAGNIIKAANVKISKKGIMLLSRLEPEQQKEAAEMLAAGEVKTVEEYEKKQAHIQREQPLQREPPPAEDRNPERNQPNENPVREVPANKGTAHLRDEETDGGADGKAQDKPMPVGRISKKQVEAPAVKELPFNLGGKQYATFKESAADLKNADKNVPCTPDIFLAEFTATIDRVRAELSCFGDQGYRVAYPDLTNVQFQYFRSKVNDLRADLASLLNLVKGMKNT